MTPHEVLSRFMALTAAGEIQERAMFGPDGTTLVGYIFSTSAVVCVMTPYPEVARSIEQVMTEGDDTTTLRVAGEPCGDGDLNLLTSQERLCVTLHRDGKSPRVIASAVGVSASTVRRRLETADAKLKGVLTGR